MASETHIPVYTRCRYTVLKSWAGKRIIIDNFAQRYRKLKKRVFNWADICSKQGWFSEHGVHVVMVTLTYDVEGTLVPASDWKAGHVRAYMHRLRDYLGCGLLAYAWVAELQRKGTVHYHVLVVYRGRRVPYPDKVYKDKYGREQPKMWAYGLSKIEKARTVFYICKYVGKEYQKDWEHYPSGAHAWGMYIREGVLRDLFRLWCLPIGLQAIVKEFGWEALHDDCNSSNYWREFDDRIWYAGSTVSLGLAERL